MREPEPDDELLMGVGVGVSESPNAGAQGKIRQVRSSCSVPHSIPQTVGSPLTMTLETFWIPGPQGALHALMVTHSEKTHSTLLGGGDPEQLRVSMKRT
jgi:hypothetical protein